MIKLTLKQTPTVPLEAEVISPDTLVELSAAEIRQLTLFHGKRQLPLGDYFDVEGEKSDEVEVHGDLHRVRWLGRGMTRGSLTVHGSVGMHLGARMRGGRIEVFGDAGDWIGAEMRRGFIHVHGNAGGQIGAAYRGSLAGMRDGTIIVDGSAGLEVGMRMRRGTIVVRGRAKDFVGLQMKGGTIVLCDGAEIRTGAWMVRGTIVSLQPLSLLPTFSYGCDHNPLFMRLLANHLAPYGVALPADRSDGCYRQYQGDVAVPGKGEILVWQSARGHEAGR